MGVFWSQQFKQTPLDVQHHQFRLVKFFKIPGRAEAIAFDIERFNIDDAPEYIALSYRWGPPTPLFYIYHVHSRSYLNIRQILFEFLQEIVFRPCKDASITGCDESSMNRWFWVDQLCIDQNSIVERNHQVCEMAQIFGSAKQVWAWLEPTDDGLKQLVESSKPSYMSFHELNQKPYWRRLWIIQELFHARYAVFIAGRTWVNDVKLRKRLMLFQMLDTSVMGTIFSARFWPKNGSVQLMPLFKTLLEFRNSDCEDPRDKIYGLMSLVQHDQRFQIDYSKSVVDICQDVLLELQREGYLVEMSRPILGPEDLGRRLKAWNDLRHALDEDHRSYAI